MRTNKCVWCEGAQLTIGANNEGHGIVFRRCKTSSGFAISAWCMVCDRPAKPGHFEPHGAFSGDEVAAMHWLSTRADSQQPCRVCREDCIPELHHLAPREMFGDACEQWPTVMVCKRCHDQWHNVVEMYRRGE